MTKIETIVDDKKDYKVQFHVDTLKHLMDIKDLFELKTIIFILFKVQNSKSSKENFIEISLDELKYNINYRSPNNVKIKKLLTKLSNNTETLFDLKYLNSNKKVVCNLKEDKAYLVTNLKTNFMKFQMLDFVSINSLNSCKIFLYLKRFENTGQWIIKRDDFIEIMNLNKKINTGKIKDRTLNPAIKNLKDLFPDLKYEINDKIVKFNWSIKGNTINIKELEEKYSLDRVNNRPLAKMQAINLLKVLKANETIKFSELMKDKEKLKHIYLLADDYRKEINNFVFNDLYFQYFTCDLFKKINLQDLNNEQIKSYEFLNLINPELLKILFKQKIIDYDELNELINEMNKKLNILMPYIIKNKLIDFNDEFTETDFELCSYFRKENEKYFEYFRSKYKKREFELFNNIKIPNSDLTFQNAENIFRFGLLSDSEGIVYCDISKLSYDKYQFHYTNNQPFVKKEIQRVNEIDLENEPEVWSSNPYELSNLNKQSLKSHSLNLQVELKPILIMDEKYIMPKQAIDICMNSIKEPPVLLNKNIPPLIELCKAYDHLFETNLDYEKEIEKMQNSKDETIRQYGKLIDEWIKDTYKIIESQRDNFSNYMLLTSEDLIK